MRIWFYISGHGFGHASRAIELMNAIAAKRPSVRLTARTEVPPWLFEDYAATPVDVQPCEVDTGVVQIGSLRTDEEATARRAAAFYRDIDRRADEEGAALKRDRVDIVLGDIPPLAFLAAARAGVPSVAIGNFTWDWIYGHYRAFETLAPGVVATIRQAYMTATAALRLPLHGGFESIASITRDVPFIARRSTRDRAETRRLLGVPDHNRLALVSFGAYGVDLPLDEIRRANPSLTIVMVDRPPRPLKYQDIVAAADVVLSKPGYGIVSECAAHGTPLLYTDRGRFIEYDVFVAGMPRVLRCRYISHEDLFAGRWTEAIDSLLLQPHPPERARVDGAEVAADAILGIGIQRS